MSAKFITSVLTAGAMVAALSVATPASALNQDQRNIVGGLVLGVIGTIAVHEAQKKKKVHQKTHVCHNPRQAWYNGRWVTVCN